MSTSIARPPDYAERVYLVLTHLLSSMDVADVATACGVHESSVSRWRSRRTVPSDPATLARLARVDLGLLVYGPTERLRAALGVVAQ